MTTIPVNMLNAPTIKEVINFMVNESLMVDAMGPTRAGTMMRAAAAYITEHESLLTRIQVLQAELTRVEQLVHRG